LDVVTNTSVAGVDIVPSSSWLVGAEKFLAGEVGAETILRRNLEALTEGRWDYALVDCPPTLGVLTVNALAATSEVLVPVEAHVMALSGLAQLIETVQLVRERLNPELTITGILTCRVDARTRHAQEVVEQLRERFGNLVYESVIRENVRVAEAPSFSVPITIYDKRSYGAADYWALADEVIAQEDAL
jgi:chromosome partitioning protein